MLSWVARNSVLFLHLITRQVGLKTTTRLQKKNQRYGDVPIESEFINAGAISTVMNQRNLKFFFFIALLLLFVLVLVDSGDAQKTNAGWKADIPKSWIDDEIAALEIPLSDPASSPRHILAEYYYRIPVRPIYKSYPVYAPGREPSGYIEQLTRQEPEVIFDNLKLKTRQDWIKAGE